jgi:isocitrate/isopropylmalate dehydrogenase
MAMILTAGMMLGFLGLEQAAAEAEKAVEAVLGEAKTLPGDLGGNATTAAIGQAVIDKLS